MKHKIFRLPRLIIIIGIICGCIGVIPGYTLTAHADTRPGGNVTDPVVRAVNIAKPAVVRIITSINSRLTVHFSSGDVTFPQGGGIQSGSNGYLLQASGTGTFITANGDILTADHVINPPKNDLQQFLYTRAAADVAAYMNKNSQAGATQVTADQVTQQLSSGQLKSDVALDKASSEIFLSTDYSGPLTATDFNSLPSQLHAAVDKIEKESSVDQKDIAIIHAPYTDTPSVQLGDSSTVQPQDDLTIIGFPGNADVSRRPNDLLTSSVNKINVSAIKTTDNGAPVIQVGGNVEHGDSGGPALDSNGNVVGIVSFGIASQNASGGTSFLQASNSARSMIKELNLNTTPGTFQKLWSDAFNNYAATTPGHWHAAQRQFEQLAANYALFKAITPYLDYTRTQAQSETTTPVPATPTAGATTGQPRVTQPAANVTSPWQAIALTVAVIGGILGLVIVLSFTLIRRRKPKSQPISASDKQSKIDTSVPSTPHISPSSVGSQSPSSTVVTTQSKGAAQAVTPPANSAQATGSQTLSLRVWPCGHMNRPTARFCSICGEPAPTPPTRH